MKQWISGSFGLGAMLLALFVLLQWSSLADAGAGRPVPHVQQAAAGETPAHLGWMLEQHWRAVNGLK